jgi:hypothetical protein
MWNNAPWLYAVFPLVLSSLLMFSSYLSEPQLITVSSVGVLDLKDVESPVRFPTFFL